MPPGWADCAAAGDNRRTMSESRMQPLGLGDRGPAVADVHAALRSLSLLPAAPDGSPDGSPTEAALYDEATELAVRHFQQVRGLSVDGRVGEPGTYRLTQR